VNEEQLQEGSAAKNISLGIEGIFLGLLFFILVLLTLNYFRIISLSFLHSTLSVLPQKEQIANKNTSTKNQGVLIAEEKAKKAGYSVAWAGDTEDGSGRAILASEERKYEELYDSFGWTYMNKYNLEKPDLFRGIFTFRKWEKIANSNDYYAIMINPIDSNEYKARILVDKSYLSSAIYSQLNEFDNLGGNRTRLEIENLNYGNLNLKIKNIERIGFFFELKEEEITKIIKPGDIVTVFMIPVSETEAKQNKYQIRRDKNNNPVIISFIVRRFNGKNSIDLN